jgi:hypothetical protein
MNLLEDTKAVADVEVEDYDGDLPDRRARVMFDFRQSDALE